MRIKPRKRNSSDVDVSAFADIAFLLIIFFILTTTFNLHEGSRLSIPSGTQDENGADEENPTVNLSAQHLVFRNNAMTMAGFRRELEEMQLPELPQEERIIVLEATEDVEYEKYFQVVTAITRAGGVLAVMEEEAGGTR